MVRELATNAQKIIPAQYTADKAMVTGMGVQLDVKEGKVKLPTADTAENILIVAKERLAHGVYTAVTNLDDYFEQFVNIEAGEFVKVLPPQNQESYGTDQYDAGLADGDVGKCLVVGTDGKWKTGEGKTRYIFGGFQQEGTHKLAIIHVNDAPASAGE